jgi:hypothetical protein
MERATINLKPLINPVLTIHKEPNMEMRNKSMTRKKKLLVPHLAMLS